MSTPKIASVRAAEARERLAAEHRRRQWRLVLTAIGAVVAIVAVLIVVKVSTGAGSPKSGAAATAAATDVITDVTTVPAATLDAVGSGTISTVPAAATGAPALTANGLPRILFAGAEYCPFCAAERWALAVALSRFGTFTGLGQTASSASDSYPSTATLSFHTATYTSTYIALTAKELESNQIVDGRYAPLDTLSAADEAVMAKYDAPPYANQTGAIPFIDIGGRYIVSGSSFSPQLLQGKTHEQIAAALADPSSAIAKAIDGTANVLAAAICASTGNQPAAVCTSAGVTAGAATLAHGT